MDDNEERKKRRWYPDISKIPCAKNSLIYGILGGGAGGLLYFWRTGVVRRSCDVAVGAYLLVALVCWEVCRYRRAEEIVRINSVVKMMKEKSRNEAGDQYSDIVES